MTPEPQPQHPPIDLALNLGQCPDCGGRWRNRELRSDSPTPGPRPGSTVYVMCAHCGGIGLADGTGGVRRPTEGELFRLHVSRLGPEVDMIDRARRRRIEMAKKAGTGGAP